MDPDDRLSTKRISDKQAKITTTLILEGLEASEIKTLLPLMHQHLNVGEAKRALNENLSSALETLKKLVSVSCYTSVTLEGFKDFEEKPLRPFIQQFTSVDGFEPPKDMAIVERVSDSYTKRSTKYSIWLSPG